MRHHFSSARLLRHATWLLLAAAHGCSNDTGGANSGVNTPPVSSTAGSGVTPTGAGASPAIAGKGGSAPAANGGSGGRAIGTAGVTATAGTGGKAGAGTAGISAAGTGGSAGMLGPAAGSGGSAGAVAGTGGAHSGAGGAAGAAAGSGGGSAAGAATFTQVYAVFKTSCAGASCHVGSSTGAGGLNMSTQAMAFTSLVGVASSSCSGEKRVVAGDSDKSLLVHALQQTQLGTCTRTPKMPEGKAKLAQTDIDRVVSWVKAGAANN